MITASILADLSTHGRLALWGGLLILGGLALLAPVLYTAIRALRSVHGEQEQRVSHCGLTGREAVGRFLAHLGLRSVCIEEGARIDHYDQLRRRVKLRNESSASSSVAALAIAAHEVGHAEQFAKNYWAAWAARFLLALVVLGAAVVLVYPFATTIAGAGEVNLAGLLSLVALVAVLRLPVTLALELDATRRGKRLLEETRLAHETEQEGIAHMLRAGFRVHIAFSLALVLVIGAGVPTMWLVENGLDSPGLAGPQVAAASEFEPGESPPTVHAIDDGEGYVYPLALFVAVATVWWAFSGKARKAPEGAAPDKRVS